MNNLYQVSSYANLAYRAGGSLIGSLNKISWVGLGAWTVYHLVDSGLANLFTLETLTHGTGPHGYIGISRNGADPNFGGSKFGSSAGIDDKWYLESSKNYFYVFSDSTLTFPCDHLQDIFQYSICKISEKEIIHIAYLLPRIHATWSGYAAFKNTVGELPAALIGACTPTLKFRFLPEETRCLESCPNNFYQPFGEDRCPKPCRFEDDPDYSELAFRTRTPIGPEHLGITGSLIQGFKGNVLERMKAQPARVAKGLAELLAASGVLKLTVNFLRQRPAPLHAAPSLFQSTKRIALATMWLVSGTALAIWNTL